LTSRQRRQARLEAHLRAAQLDTGLVTASPLRGGAVAETWLLTYDDGRQLVAKTMLEPPPGLHAAEAAGLEVLAQTGTVATPAVVAVREELLVLEAMAPRVDTEAFWEQLADDLAALHDAEQPEVFGWPSDGYLGRVVQRNALDADGYRFFAEQRLLRYVEEPPADAAMTREDRLALERLCERLPELLPPAKPVLTHGDLWSGNVVATADGRPALIDPAVSYGWAEVDLSMLWASERPPASDRLFARYAERRPQPPGFEARVPILHLRELLSVVAHVGDLLGTMRAVRATLAPFAPRGARPA
jgi:fructosamine-3-kinase